MNTLKMTGTQEEYDTFVYKGGGDSDEELEAEGTILDNSLLKQYTEQLETFVFKGFDDNDSDYFTGGSVGNKGSKDKENDSEDEDVSGTLLRQYSETLAASDDDEGTIVNVGSKNVQTNSQVDGPVSDVKSKVQTVETDNVKLGATSLGNLESDDDEEEDRFEATLDLKVVSKYQYKGLKDTFALRPDKRWKKPHMDPSELFAPLKDDQLEKRNAISGGNRNKVPNSSSRNSRSVSILSSTGTINGTRERDNDPRLLQTLEGHSLKKTRAPKVPISDKIEQSVINRSEFNRHKSPKNAFVQLDNSAGESDVDVNSVISHLRENITPFTSVDSQSETIRPRNPDASKPQVTRTRFSLFNMVSSSSNLQSKLEFTNTCCVNLISVLWHFNTY